MMAEEQKTASALVREEANRLASSDEAVKLRAAATATENAAWGKNLDAAHRMAIEKVARELNLSTALGHVIALGGLPYVTCQGRLANAQAHGGFEGFDEGRLDKSEWPEWGVAADAEFAWKCTVIRAGKRYTEVGWAGGKRESNQPVARQFPGEMARARGRSRALAIAFPIGLPSAEERSVGIEIPDEIINKIMPARLVEMASFKIRLDKAGVTLAEARQAAEMLYNAKRLELLTEPQADELIAKCTQEVSTDGTGQAELNL